MSALIMPASEKDEPIEREILSAPVTANATGPESATLIALNAPMSRQGV
jgi:hypothetical protein